jgi:hypothetical protein
MRDTHIYRLTSLKEIRKIIVDILVMQLCIKKDCGMAVSDIDKGL